MGNAPVFKLSLPPAIELPSEDIYNPLAPWAKRKLKLAAMAPAWERAAAVGAAAWLCPVIYKTRRSARKRKRELIECYMSGNNPVTKARLWFSGLSHRQRDDVFGGAYGAIDRLGGEIALVSRGENRGLALSWLETRDDLDAVLLLSMPERRNEHGIYVAEGSPSYAALRAALSDLDRDASVMEPTLNALDLHPGTPQLRASAKHGVWPWWSVLVLEADHRAQLQDLRAFERAQP